MKMKNIKKEMKDFMLMFAIIFAVPLSIAGMLFTAKAFIKETPEDPFLLFLFLSY